MEFKQVKLIVNMIQNFLISREVSEFPIQI
jgi:hypothetical protein